jgi:hypothetical protein
LPGGEHRIGNQIVVDRRITVTSVGKNLDDPVCSEADGDCAVLVATSELNQSGGIFLATALEAVHHLVLDGNKSGRGGTKAYSKCATHQNNTYGFNATIASDNVQIAGNIFKNALCGTGLIIHPGYQNVEIRENRFADNGVHNKRGLWADGLTVHDLSQSSIVANTFVDNTDIDLILGGCQDCVIQSNVITHTDDLTGGSFAALMIQKWANTSGNYTGTDISGNVVDCGPNRDCGSALYIGSEGWYNQTPVGSLIPNEVGAEIHHNTVRNAKNGMYIAARGFSIYANDFTNAHGVPFKSSCGTLTSLAPIVVSPTAETIDFRGENVDPVTSDLFASQDWDGCIPNWPF